MARRLLLLLAGLGGAAIAAVLWSGTAYASTPAAHETASAPGALGGLLAPVASNPIPLPPLAPPPPAAPRPKLPPVAQRVVDTLPPVVSRTVTKVARVAAPVPVVGPLVTPVSVATHDAVRTTATKLAAAPGVVRRSTVALRHHHTARFATRASVTSNARRTPASSKHHATPAPLPLGVNDAPSGAGGAGGGAPYAVTGHDEIHAPDSWSTVSTDVARAPAMVVLRDIARPG